MSTEDDKRPLETCLIVPGTWAERGRNSTGATLAYWEKDGSFVLFLKAHGFNPLYVGRRWWTGNLEGSPIERLFKSTRTQAGWHRDWKQGGENISHGLQSLVATHKTIVFVHSHGLQAVLYALARADCPPIGALCSVGSPDRADMRDVAVLAREKILGPWIHLADGSWNDWLKIVGTLGTGTLWDTLGYATGLSKGPLLADVRHTVNGVAHSGLLEDITLYHHWLELKVLEQLKKG